MPSLMFEIQDFNDNDTLISSASSAPAERIADQVIAAWTDLLQTQVEKDPSSDSSDDQGRSNDDGDDE